MCSAEWAALSPPPVTACKRFTRRGEGTPPYGSLLRCAGGLKGGFGAAIPPYEGCALSLNERRPPLRDNVCVSQRLPQDGCSMVHCYAGAGGWKGRFGAAISPYEGCACRSVPPDGTCARRFVLVPPVVFLLHACRPIRWWIRFRCDGSHAG